MAPSVSTQEDSTPLNKEKAIQYDVSSKIMSYLDPHLAFRALKMLEQQQIYSNEDIKKAKLEVLKKTYMIDEAKDIHQELYPDGNSSDLDQQREEIISRLKTVKTRVQSLLEIVENEELVNKLRQENNFTLNHLSSEYKIEEQQVEDLYAHAKARFECGDYNGAGYYLEVYRRLSQDGPNVRAALWGQLAAHILVPNWEQAADLLPVVRDTVEHEGSGNHAMQMQRRVWLLHWSLFIVAHHPTARETIVELFSQELTALETLAPHLLRHFIVAVISRKRRGGADLIRPVLHDSENTINDPVVQFVSKLLVSHDFDGALDELEKCRDAVKSDIFVSSLETDFYDGALFLFCENYCRLHSIIDLEKLSMKLNMNVEKMEEFMANVIRNSKMHAKIDSNENRIVVDIRPPNVYQQVLGKVDEVTQRTGLLRNLLMQQTQPNHGNKSYHGSRKSYGKGSKRK